MADLPPELAKAAAGLAGPAIGAAAGALMRHSQLAQAGQRRFWSLHLLYELPTVVGMGIIGGGLSAYLQFPELAGWGVSAALGFYGAHGLTFITAAAARRLGIDLRSASARPAQAPSASADLAGGAVAPQQPETAQRAAVGQGGVVGGAEAGR